MATFDFDEHYYWSWSNITALNLLHEILGSWGVEHIFIYTVWMDETWGGPWTQMVRSAKIKMFYGVYGFGNRPQTLNTRLAYAILSGMLGIIWLVIFWMWSSLCKSKCFVECTGSWIWSHNLNHMTVLFHSTWYVR